MRKTIDSDFAQFRGNTFDVVKIFEKNNPMNTKDKISNTIFPKKIVYDTKKTVIVDTYDKDINKKWTDGIHYFKSLEPAFYFQKL